MAAKFSAGPSHAIRADQRLIAGMVEPGSRVLDVGCGNGELLELLTREKNVDGRGIEIEQDRVNAAVARGLSVIHGDAESDLIDYPGGAFDYVILGQTLPEVRNPREVLSELLRIGAHAIVSIPNFGHWRHRLHLLLTGEVPSVGFVNARWYTNPNIHPCTIRDFVDLCEELGVAVERFVLLGQRGRASRFLGSGWLANLFGEQAIFLLKRSH
ncbi:MAG: methionine biosynthesis protein MetW [Alphaproteobacteria bacterium]|nr:methionine biosynthesis protein MetW [Alphaproteobacteria bacterium]